MCKHTKIIFLIHSLFLERQEEIRLAKKINDILNCLTVIALAQPRAEGDDKWTKLEQGRKKKGWKKKAVYDRGLAKESGESIFPVFTSSERPKREESIKADLIYEVSVWLEEGRRAWGEKRKLCRKMWGV